jgi:hypothetical protein
MDASFRSEILAQTRCLTAAGDGICTSAMFARLSFRAVSIIAARGRQSKCRWLLTVVKRADEVLSKAQKVS